jgi:CDP-diacylglycerol--glycerol-3-phosphate 3-phosphatidyltransferase
MRLSFRQVPNALSLSRIPAAFAFLLTNDPHAPVYFWISMCIVGFAFLTDILDGYLARLWKVESTTGYFLDGIGDKVFTVAVLLVISREHPSQLYLAWVLIVREIMLYALRALDTERDRNIGSLRVFSLAQAICLRLYFLGFFFESAHLAHEMPLPANLSIYHALGYAAAILGCVSIFLLSKRIIAKELSL